MRAHIDDGYRIEEQASYLLGWHMHNDRGAEVSAVFGGTTRGHEVAIVRASATRSQPHLPASASSVSEPSPSPHTAAAARPAWLSPAGSGKRARGAQGHEKGRRKA
jgi:hypothetical protein